MRRVYVKKFFNRIYFTVFMVKRQSHKNLRFPYSVRNACLIRFRHRPEYLYRSFHVPQKSVSYRLTFHADHLMSSYDSKLIFQEEASPSFFWYYYRHRSTHFKPQ